MDLELQQYFVLEELVEVMLQVAGQQELPETAIFCIGAFGSGALNLSKEVSIYPWTGWWYIAWVGAGIEGPLHKAAKAPTAIKAATHGITIAIIPPALNPFPDLGDILICVLLVPLIVVYGVVNGVVYWVWRFLIL